MCESHLMREKYSIGCFWRWREPHGEENGWLLEAESGLWVTASKETETLCLAYARNWILPKPCVFRRGFQPLYESAARMTLILALWVSHQKTQSIHHYKLWPTANKWALFYAAKFVQFFIQRQKTNTNRDISFKEENHFIT